MSVVSASRFYPGRGCEGLISKEIPAKNHLHYFMVVAILCKKFVSIVYIEKLIDGNFLACWCLTTPEDALASTLIPDGLKAFKVKGDGSCIYNSISMFLKGDL